VPNDKSSVTATSEQLSGVHVDMILVESLGLTEVGGIFQPYS
jgi:hypothetical protein